MEAIMFTPEFVAGIASIILTLVFAYFPKLRVWFAGLASEMKSLIMLGLFALISGITFALAFNGIIPTDEPLTWVKLVQVFIMTLVASQPAYLILPQAKDVKEAKMLRDYATLEEEFGEAK
jgi:hypothetical protein